jgi:carboxypeptidase Taq
MPLSGLDRHPSLPAARPQPRTDFLHRTYPVERQRAFSGRVMALMGLDRGRCGIAETEHPFTDGSNKWDVRITTHYHEDDLASSLYSVVHEGGHALYEMGVDDALQFTVLGGGSTMGIHESQSRFYENLIGRSEPFCRALFPIAAELFPEQLADVTEEEFYRAVNQSSPSLIRTEADELTYPMHILVRYEMERRMIGGEVSVKELPALWRELYREYLGVEVPSDREGILQDSHWSGGAFGYFPSYALGSAYGVQMLEAMEREVSVWDAVAAGDLSPVTAWLRERIHRHGKLLRPAELLRSAGVDPFRPECYTDYLKRKFTAIYGL